MCWWRRDCHRERLPPTLPQPAPLGSVEPTIVGDLTPIDTNPEEPGVQFGTDANGNLITDPDQADPGRDDNLYDSQGNDRIQGLGGQDILQVFWGGNDILEGGEGSDVLLGGHDNDKLYAEAQQAFAELIVLNNH